jgi:hypothetical protein
VDLDGSVFVYGAVPGEQLGLAVLWLDLDDDGEQELLLLAPGRQGEAERRGRLYLVEVSAR